MGRLILLTALAALLPAAPTAQAAIGLVPMGIIQQAADQGSRGDDLAYRPNGDYGYARRTRAPRYYHTPRYAPPIVTQLSIGFYDPSGEPGRSFLLDARVGPQLDPNVQLGLMVDWAHKSDRASETFGSETVGGVDLGLEDSRVRGRTDLIPMLAFVQVGGNEPGRPSPYAGLGAGYELLSLEAEQPDGSRFDGTFGGWGWQGWVGLGLPLAYQARLTGEIFYNHADLGRDVTVDRRSLRQTADFNGPGMRFGLAWGF
jgi:hypothetical protein